MVDDFTVEIDLAQAQRNAEAARNLLLVLRARYDLSGWEYTRAVRIAPMERPHSHPVLTLSTRHLTAGPGGEDSFLSVYLHEQIHWALYVRCKEETVRAMDEFRKHYPDLHTDGPETARNEKSTYLHLAVNWLEIAATAEFIGRERAEAVARRSYVYSRIYRVVIDENDGIERILTESGVLPLPSAR